MTIGDLPARLRRRIRAEGPLTVATFMAEALGEYYGSRDPLGAARAEGGGDFITAPEISQMFGELIGAWVAEQWQALGRPSPIHLVELGPGRGTLMADALRVLRRVPGLLDAARIQLVETSPSLRRRQRAALGPTEITWHNALGKVPDGPLLLIANEFFDALPVRQLVHGEDGWAERCVGLDGERFAWLLDGRTGPLLVPPELRDAPPGSVVELCPAGVAIAGDIGARIVRSGGAALLIDYGYATPTLAPTLQAVRAHRFAEFLEAPGEADLTAHVDFGALAGAARAAGAAAHGPIDQGILLRRLGIVERAGALRRLASAAQAADIDAALARLIDDAAMGTLFKALALTGPGAAPPPGFAA